MRYGSCVVCKGVANIDIDYKAGIEHSFCNRCGSIMVSEVTKWKNNEPIEWKETLKEGFGVYRIATMEGHAVTGSFTEPLTMETVQSFKQRYYEEKTDKEGSFLASWENGKQNLLVGNKIPDIHRLLFKDWDQLMEKGVIN